MKNFDAKKINQEWSYAKNKEDKIHRIHAYPAKFPAFITEKAIEYISRKGYKIESIADIFCGCGTVAYEAKKKDINFLGYDINPVAILIAKTKVGNYKIEKLNFYFEKIKKDFHTKSNISITDINQRIFYWFDEEQIKKLKKLKNAIYIIIPNNSKYKKFFICAFSNILKHCSRWLQKSIKPTIDTNKKNVNVWQKFTQQFNMMKLAIAESNEYKSYKSAITIKQGNFFKMPKNKVDLIITSPPYITSYEYADLHQLSTLWLDYSKDYKLLRRGTIGSIYNNFDYEKDKDRLNKTAINIIDQLEKVEKKRAKSATKYYIDMQLCVKNAYDMIKLGGYILFVIGNTEYRKVKVKNAEQLEEAMIDVGFKDIKVIKRKISNKILTPYRDKEGKFSSNKKGRKIYAEEFIIIGKKQNETPRAI